MSDETSPERPALEPAPAAPAPDAAPTSSAEPGPAAAGSAAAPEATSAPTAEATARSAPDADAAPPSASPAAPSASPAAPSASPAAPSRASDAAAEPRPVDGPRVSSPDHPRRSRPSLAPQPQPPPSLRERLTSLVLAPLRDPNPILLKELRATFRTALFIRFLYLLTGLVAVAVLLGGAMIGEGNTPPADVGSALFHIFFGLVLGVLCLVAPSYAATAITTEHETRTYESLVLSGMGAWRIVWGKFLAYFGSIVLIVVAISPVIGVAFLFGGVSPSSVLVAFFWTLVILATAVSWGLAISTRLESTRISITLSTVIFVPVAMMLTGFVTALGEEAQRAWATPFDGPFWFAEAFPQRIDTLDGWAALVFLPGFVFGAAIWFFLASSVAGLRHPGEDRSTPLKVWAAVVAPLSVVAGAVPVGLVYPGLPAVTHSGIGMSFVAGLVGLFIGLTFANEPPLPPRARTKPSLLTRVLSIVGPGAAGTTRFALLAAMTPPLGVAAVSVLAQHMASGSVGMSDAADGALFVVGVGNALVAAAFTALAVVLRLWARNGVVARLLALVVLAAAILVPVLLSLVLEPNVFDYGNRLPALMALSPIGSIWASVLLSEHAPLESVAMVFTGHVLYGGAALVMWLGIEAFVLRVKRADAARRAAKPSAPAGAGG
ncbi:MAG: ABC transporter permease [Sandaracinus sp.]